VSAKQNAINALKSNRTVVLGPPGTGKTTTMMEVIGLLLADGYRPEDIAFVSFSKKAVNEAKERAIKRFDLDDESLRNFRTLQADQARRPDEEASLGQVHGGDEIPSERRR
jgi:superfamily I DNA/RNA helicase